MLSIVFVAVNFVIVLLAGAVAFIMSGICYSCNFVVLELCQPSTLLLFSFPSIFVLFVFRVSLNFPLAPAVCLRSTYYFQQ